MASLNKENLSPEPFISVRDSNIIYLIMPLQIPILGNMIPLMPTH